MIAAISPGQLAAILVGVGVLLGWLLATLLRRQDHRTFVLGRAPELPIRALAVHDDAWLRGVVTSDQPLRCPWFEIDCVAYVHRIERQVTRTRTVREANGKTRTETYTTWESAGGSSETIGFDLVDGARVRVALPEGTNEAMQSTGHDYETSTRRHSASYLPIGAEVSVLGVLRDDRTFGPLREVPLLVTAETRTQRVRSSARSEGALFCFALLLPFAGVGAAAGVLRDAATWQDWLLALPFGLLVLVPQWWLLTFNRLVRLRQQVRTAQQQIAVDLALRADLVPNLVEIVKVAAGHEQGLLERLSALREGQRLDAQVRHERSAAAVAREVLVLHEAYPGLRTDAVYRDLHERLWAIEEKIAHSRNFYDDVVTEWNGRVERFPSVLVAKSRGFRSAPLFALDTDEESMPPRLVGAPDGERRTS